MNLKLTMSFQHQSVSPSWWSMIIDCYRCRAAITEMKEKRKRRVWSPEIALSLDDTKSATISSDIIAFARSSYLLPFLVVPRSSQHNNYNLPPQSNLSFDCSAIVEEPALRLKKNSLREINKILKYYHVIRASISASTRSPSSAQPSQKAKGLPLRLQGRRV